MSIRLPSALSNERREQLFQKMAELGQKIEETSPGHSDRSWLAEQRSAARQELIEGNLGLVLKVVTAVAGGKVDENTKEDLVGEGSLALIRAVDDFALARGVPFSAYAFNVIRRAIWDYRAKEHRRERLFRQDTAVGDEESELEKAVEDRGLQEVDDEDSTEEMLRSFSERDRVILRGLADGETLGEIGRRVGGLSRQRIYRLVKSVVRRAKELVNV